MYKHEKYYKLLGRNIAYYRKKRHLTQYGLAFQAHLSRGYLSSIEATNCKESPSLDMLFNLCEHLYIEPYQLFIERE